MGGEAAVHYRDPPRIASADVEAVEQLIHATQPLSGNYGFSGFPAHAALTFLVLIAMAASATSSPP
jgi:hypothetical protein